MPLDPLNFFEYALLFMALYYAGTLIYFAFGLSKKNNKPKNINTPPVSVIIAVRNGEKNIYRLLNTLKNQTYNGEMEFIIVDDESIDKTPEIINEFADFDTRFKYFSSKNGDRKLRYKKRALDLGIQNAQYEILLFTDIDCIIQDLWVESMISDFTDDTDYIVGYSEAINTETSASRFQKTDFFMLLCAARGMVNNQSGWACSGQNQGYRRELYNTVGGFNKIAKQLQGDDSLFLLLCRKAKNINVNFANSPGSFVTSRPELQWSTFLKQRIRWAGDSKVFWKFNITFYITSLITFLFNLAIIASPIFYGITIFQTPWFINIIILKIIVEYTLFTLGKNAFDRQFSITEFLQWFIIQPFYIIIVAMASILRVNPTWQGRNT